MSGEKWSIRPALERWARQQDEIAKCRKEAEAFGFSFDEHYAFRNGLEDPEPPDDWERENQAAMIEAVRRKAGE